MKLTRKVTRGTKRPFSDWLNYDDAAKYLGVSSRTVRRWTSAGLLPHAKYAGRVYFREAFLRDFIEESVRGKV